MEKGPPLNDSARFLVLSHLVLEAFVLARFSHVAKFNSKPHPFFLRPQRIGSLCELLDHRS